MWLWLAITLIFFSIPASKLVGYVLAAVPPAAVLAADGFARFVSVRGGQQRWLSAMAAIALLLCAVGLAGGVLHERNNIQRLIAQVRPAADIGQRRGRGPAHLPLRPRLLPAPSPADAGRRGLGRAAGCARRTAGAASCTRRRSFDPARAQTVLTTPQAFARLLACSRRTVWVFASKDEATRQPELARLQPVAAHGTYAVWRRPAPTAPGDRAGLRALAV